MAHDMMMMAPWHGRSTLRSKVWMGGGVSLPPGSDGDNALAFVSAETRSAEDQFALDVIQKRYEDQVAAAAAKGEGDFQVTEDVLRDYGKIRDLALKEFALPLEECQCPAVVLYKYTSKTDDERKAFNDAVMAQTVDREKRRERTLKERKKLDNFDDNDKSFGGTKEDSQQEKEAAALMRGETASSKNFHADDFHIFPLLQPPLLEHNDERRPLDDAGVWKKFLGATEAGPVAMYINTLSRHIVSLRPEAYEDEVAPVAEEEAVDPANGLPKVDPADIPLTVHTTITELKKTPLLLDCSTEQVARTFYQYKGICEDVSGLVVPFGKSGVKRQDVVERLRKSLVSAMKTGTIFAMYLGEVNIAHADFKTKLCTKDSFPAETFQLGGLKLLQPDYEPRYKKLYREEDLENGQAIVREGFQVVVISSLSAHDYQGKLADCIPLGYMHPLYIVPPS